MSVVRAVSAALHTPQLGGHTVTGAQNSLPSPLSSPKKASTPKLKYEAVEITEVGGPFERKVLRLYITVTLGPFQSKVFTHYSWYCGRL